MNYNGVKYFILEKLSRELNATLYYHDLSHTLDVLHSVERLADLENVTGEDLILLQTASLFHDAGMIRTYLGHEQASVEMIEEFLPHFGYNPPQIAKINKMIMTTRLPQSATGTLEQILCDADLDYLGRDDFFMIAHRLKLEWAVKNIKPTTLKEWYLLQISFLTTHRYFTKSAIESREAKKQKNLLEIHEILNGQPK
jgi:predicted metal-dependent HD superfamily phosphohydrolase